MNNQQYFDLIKDYSPENPLHVGIWRMKLWSGWVLGTPVFDELIGPYTVKMVKTGFETVDRGHFVREFDLMHRFTGLYDSKGVPIFEGDEVELVGIDLPIVEVAWRAPEFVFQYKEEQFLILKKSILRNLGPAEEFNQPT